MSGSELVLKDVCFEQGDFRMQLSARIPDGELACLLGPSGCGKTTLLRLIGGFAPPTSGSIFLGGKDITDVPAHLRRLGIVFQDYALFPNLSVGENIGYGLKTDRKNLLPSGSYHRRVSELLSLVGLEGSGKRRISSLSGGERQRVALARAIAPSPRLLLLDEPLSALDAPLRASLGRAISRIQQTLGITTVYITHDQKEALTLSNRIFLMKEGRVVQDGTPKELYREPNSLFSAKFIGSSNIFPSSITETNGTGVVVETPLGRLSVEWEQGWVFPGDSTPQPGCRGSLFFRPEGCSIERDPGVGSVDFTGRVMGVEYHGAFSMVEVEVGKVSVTVMVFHSQAISVNDRVGVRVWREGLRWLPSRSSNSPDDV